MIADPFIKFNLFFTSKNLSVYSNEKFISCTSALHSLFLFLNIELDIHKQLDFWRFASPCIINIMFTIPFVEEDSLYKLIRASFRNNHSDLFYLRSSIVRIYNPKILLILQSQYMNAYSEPYYCQHFSPTFYLVLHCGMHCC